MGSTKPSRNVLAALAIMLLLASADLFVLAPWIFGLRQRYALGEIWVVLPLLAAPRLTAGLMAAMAVAMLAGFASSIWTLVGYAALLFWIFHRSEVYVDWSSAHAIAAAVLPYASGLIGMCGGIGIGRVMRGGPPAAGKGEPA